MKSRLAIGCLLAGLGADLAAAEWVSISDTVDYNAYVDAASLSWSGNNVRLWDLIELKVPGTSPRGNIYSSSLANSEFDCTGARVRTLHFSLHAGPRGNGDIVEIPAPSDAWLPVASGSLLEILWRYACAAVPRTATTGAP